MILFIKLMLLFNTRTFQLALLFCLFFTVGCKGQGNNDQQDFKGKAAVYKSKTHQYSNYTLVKLGDEYRCNIIVDSFRYEILEEIRGILVHHREPSNYERYPTVTKNTTLIEYYDTTTHILKKRLDLEAITPYNRRTHKNISIGLLDYEYMDMYGPDSNCQWPKLPAPSYYYTRNSVLSISPNGYICVSFELIKMAKPNNMVVGWEQTMMVLDPTGNELMRLAIDHEILYPVVSSDGKILFLESHIGQNTQSEPFTACKNGLFLYDLVAKKIVFERYFPNAIDAGRLQRPETDKIWVVSVTDKDKPIERLIIDPLNREIKNYKIRDKERDLLARGIPMEKILTESKETLSIVKF